MSTGDPDDYSRKIATAIEELRRIDPRSPALRWLEDALAEVEAPSDAKRTRQAAE